RWVATQRPYDVSDSAGPQDYLQRNRTRTAALPRSLYSRVPQLAVRYFALAAACSILLAHSLNWPCMRSTRARPSAEASTSFSTFLRYSGEPMPSRMVARKGFNLA